jgi:AcrR family transcriptional regulator
MSAAGTARDRASRRAVGEPDHASAGVQADDGCSGHRAGRRRGESGAREAILQAARDEFAAHGFDKATIRGIASCAGVDPALVLHYFGSKNELFGDAISIPVEPAEVFRRSSAAGRDDIGALLVEAFLDTWEAEENRQRLIALLRSAMTNDTALAHVREYLGCRIFGPIIRELNLPDGELRATLVGSQLIGLAMMRYVSRMEPLASASRDDLVAAIAPGIQRYLTGDLSAGRPDDAGGGGGPAPTVAVPAAGTPPAPRGSGRAEQPPRAATRRAKYSRAPEGAPGAQPTAWHPDDPPRPGTRRAAPRRQRAPARDAAERGTRRARRGVVRDRRAAIPPGRGTG